MKVYALALVIFFLCTTTFVTAKPFFPGLGCNPICPAIGSPVCGTDGEEYGNKCLLAYASCVSGGIIQEARPESCGLGGIGSPLLWLSR
ncbi:turripeptide Lol9.1-like [Dendronephthya gigantea]|uniref:turripeptide Lol9.1-like n=1 Tax=Dendronephthya gigantea TaxID=151771 RepID=UPI00106C4C11|nr:turripeptide Lol9.1-like [Dendronephthya gigantea]